MSAIARSLRRLPFPALSLPIVTVAMATGGLGGILLATDSEPWRAGDRTTISQAADQDASGAILRRAAVLEVVLGLSGAAERRVDVVEDRFAALAVDEISYSDARGRPTGFLRLARDGRLLTALRLGYRDAYAEDALSGSEAGQAAREIATALGAVPPDGPPTIRSTMNGLMWTVAWPRTADGFLVDGDGTTVRLWRSGDLHSVSVSERPLSPPASVMDAATARAILESRLPAVVADHLLADAGLGAGQRRWVAANDQYRPERPDAPAPTPRLAWVFELRFASRTAEAVRALTFWIDAETGELIGGDVLR